MASFLTLAEKSKKLDRYRPQARIVFAVFAFLFTPYAFCLAEPRTLLLVGYIPDPATFRVAVFAAICLLATFLLDDAPSAEPFSFGVAAFLLPLIVDSPIGRVASIFLGVGGLLSLWNKSGRARRVGTASWTVGIIFGALWLMDWIYGRFESQIDLGPILATAVRIASFGLVQSHGGLVSIPSDGRAELVQMGIDKFGGLFFLGLLTLVLVSEQVRKASLAARAKTALALIAYAAVRCLIVFGAQSGSEAQNWWNEQKLLLSFAPLCIFLAIKILSEKPSERVARIKRSVVSAALTATASVLIVLGIFFPALGSQKKGWVVLDESHSDWEKSKDPINDRNFGTGTVYNYYNFREELGKHFPMRVEEHEITDATLANASVLILKTPTRPYSPEAIANIQKFVAGGGGLWMIGDHTDAFGMSTNLNQVASLYGCKFRINAWVEPPIQRNLWQGDLSTHPIVQKLGTFLFYTGCELEASPQDTALIMPRRMIVESADYSAGSFFGPLRSSASNRFGSVIAAVSGERGKGRIMMWADSTLFSNFVIYFPGKLELALNSVEWLNRENTFPLQRPLLLVTGVVLLCAGFAVSPALDVLAILFVAMAASPLSLFLFNRIQGLREADTAVRGSVVSYLELDHTFQLPHYSAIDGMGPNYYVSAFVASQRVGRRPRIAESIEDATHADTIVLIPPPEELGAARIDKLLSWVQSGGKLILPDAGKLRRHDISTLAQILHIDVPQSGSPPLALTTAAGKALGKHQLVFFVEGGKPLISGPGGKVACASIPYGKGQVILSGSFELFSDESVGDILGTPDQQQANALIAFCNILRLNPK